MSLSTNLTNAIRDGINDTATATASKPVWVIVTQDQYDAIKTDAMRRDLFRTPPPWGRNGTLTASTLGVPVVVRAIGASITDLTGDGPVLDVRDVS